MIADIVTLFPELFGTFFETSFIGRARQAGHLETRLISPRDFGLGRHRSVDDTPYGGGSGMVMRADVMLACIDSLDTPERPPAHRVLLTPQGKPFSQKIAQSLTAVPRMVLICGRYEGFDERIREHVHEEVSLGDFVMTGGEVAAMAILEATVRLLPGVLGNAHSIEEESHQGEGLLEYPQYTRPVEFRGSKVPDVLTSGNHAEIEKWRKAQSRARTEARRPDILQRPKEGEKKE